ncbi:MAG: septum formation initiator family protein [bacterium]|nr:septum formation initiator family protein [bacterium]
MIKKGKSNNFEKIFFNQKFLALIGLIVIILISFPFAKNSIKQYKINKEISDFKKEISALQSKNADLKNFVSYLESDQFAEEQARLNLNLKKPGEEKTVIKPAVGEAKVLASSTEGDQIFNIPGRKKAEPQPEVPNPKKWLNYFFRR